MYWAAIISGEISLMMSIRLEFTSTYGEEES